MSEGAGEEESWLCGRKKVSVDFWNEIKYLQGGLPSEDNESGPAAQGAIAVETRR